MSLVPLRVLLARAARARRADRVWSRASARVAAFVGVGVGAGIFTLGPACALVDDGAGDPSPTTAPGFVVSRPFADVRSLNDVVVLGVDDRRLTRALAVGTDGVALAWDGAAWSREDTGVVEDLLSVSGLVSDDGGETVLACGAGGTLLLRDDAGWRVLPSPVTEDLFGVWVRTNDDAFVVGDRGVVLRWDGVAAVQLVDEVLIDTGAVDTQTNLPVAFPIGEPLKGVMGRGPDDVFVVGARGAAYRFDGVAFQPEDTETNRPLADVFTGAGVWAATSDGVLLRRRDGVWRDDEFVAPAPVFLQGVWSRGDDDVFAVGLSETLFHREAGVWSLTTVEEATALRAIDGASYVVDDAGSDAGSDAGREIIAVGAGGRIVRGPAVLPGAGETALSTRIDDEE